MNSGAELMIPSFTLQVNNFSVRRNYQAVFSPYSFQLSNSRSLYLQGKNGSGKTTSLRVLAGVSQQYQGGIFLNQIERRELLHHYCRSFLYIGHHLSLNYDLSAKENLSYLLALRGVRVKQAVLKNVFSHLNIPQHNHPIRFLSAGQKRRVALARLWLESSPIWILDEPFTALDTHSIALLEEKMVIHLKKGGGLIFTSHQLPNSEIYTSTLTVTSFMDEDVNRPRAYKKDTYKENNYKGEGIDERSRKVRGDVE